MRLTIVLGVIFLAGCASCHKTTVLKASTVTAANCNQASVNAVINGPTHTAVDGDIIVIPAGSCTWSTSPGITIPNNIGITITGTGTPNATASTFGPSASCGATSITVSGITVFTARPSFGNSTTRISCMAMPYGGGATIAFSILGACTAGGCPNLRVDNINFTGWAGHADANNGYAIAAVGDMFGVIDHTALVGDTSKNTYLQFIQINNPVYLGVGLWGDNSWAQPDNYGSANFMYMENNVFTTSGMSENEARADGYDHEGGGRIVGRYNQFNQMDNLNFAIGWHGTESNGRPRSVRAFEFYGNSYDCPVHCNAVISWRGGTGLIWGNTHTAPSLNNAYEATTYRSQGNVNWGACDGSSVYDINDGVTYASGSITAVSGSPPSYWGALPWNSPPLYALTINQTGGSPTQPWTTNVWAPVGAPYSVHNVTQSNGGEIVASGSNGVVVNAGAGSPGSWTPAVGNSIQFLRASACIDQSIGRGVGFLYTGSDVNNFATPYQSSAEALSPTYGWMNVFTPAWGVPLYSDPTWSGTGKVIRSRDYFTENSNQAAQSSATVPFDGTTTVGIGHGTLANRPVNCTAGAGTARGVAYWATDSGPNWNNGSQGGQLFVCTPTNIWNVYYTPYVYPHPLVTGAAVTVTPGFVSESSMNNTQFTYNGNSTALGTNPSGQTACPNFSYCAPFAGKTFNGNLLIVPYTYAWTGAVTTSGSDSQSDTFTCTDGGIADSTVNIGGNASDHPRNGLCYAMNASGASTFNGAGGSDRVVVGFGSTAVTNVAANASQWNNITTSGAVDVHNAAAGASSTTANAVTITTTAAGDLIYVHVCRTGTPTTTSFTAGSGYTLLSADIHDGCATEYQVQSTAGSITPSMTMGTASTYVEQVWAFKASANAQGTAPSGLYMERMSSWSMPQGQSASTWTFQFPSAGNLLFQSLSCGVLTPSSTVPTETGATWVFTGSNSLSSPVVTGEYYAQNAAPGAPWLVTDTFTGTGDCGVKFYSFANAPSSPFSQSSQYGFSTSTSPATITTTWNSGVTGPALWILTGGESNSTGTAVTTPSSGCQWTGGSYGGMNVNGPEPIDQNNMWATCLENTTGNQTVVYSFAGTAPNGQGADLAGFRTTGGGSVTFNPTSLSFGSQNVGSSSASQNTTLMNGTGSTVNVNFSFTGTNQGDFSRTTTCGSTLAAGLSCTVSVTFTPAAAGSRTATLNETNAGITVALSGTGVTMTAPTISWSPTTLTFGSQNTGTTSASQAATLQNTGTASLATARPANLAISGTNASDFSISSTTCGSTLAAGVGCIVNVTFTPSTLGSKSATLTETDATATNSPQSVSLSGTGVGCANIAVGIWTVCGSIYNQVTNTTTNSVSYSPTAGNGVYVVGEWCGAGGCGASSTETATISTTPSSSCFIASSHSPFSMVNTGTGISSDFERFYIWYCQSIPSGINTITITTSASVAALVNKIVEIKAPAPSGFESVDTLATSGAATSTTATITTSGSTSAANDLVLASVSACGGTVPISAGTGYTAVLTTTTDPGTLIEARTASSIGVQTATATWSTQAPSYCFTVPFGTAPYVGNNNTWFGVITPLQSGGPAPPTGLTGTVSITGRATLHR